MGSIWLGGHIDSPCINFIGEIVWKWSSLDAIYSRYLGNKRQWCHWMFIGQLESFLWRHTSVYVICLSYSGSRPVSVTSVVQELIVATRTRQIPLYSSVITCRHYSWQHWVYTSENQWSWWWPVSVIYMLAIYCKGWLTIAQSKNCNHNDMG